MAKTNRAMTRIQNCLISAQELGDEKLQVVTQLQEMIELKTRQLDNDLRALGKYMCFSCYLFVTWISPSSWLIIPRMLKIWFSQFIATADVHIHTHNYTIYVSSGRQIKKPVKLGKQALGSTPNLCTFDRSCYGESTDQEMLPAAELVCRVPPNRNISSTITAWAESFNRFLTIQNRRLQQGRGCARAAPER